MLTATITWFGSVYEAALDAIPEWPPHPGRLFCALVAASRSNEDDAALRWLEAKPPPDVHVPDAATNEAGLTAYVPTNLVGMTKSNKVARTSGARSWHRSHLALPVVAFSWPVEADRAVVERLDALARRVPYLGRATSQCTVAFAAAGAPEDQGMRRYQLAPAGRHRLRVTYPGYLDALRGAFEDSQPSRTVDQRAFYAEATELLEPVPSVTVASPAYQELLALAFPRGVQLDGRLVLRITAAFKAAVLSKLGRDYRPEELALLNGHHDGTRRQCPFLALPFVGQGHASGDVLGVAVALSPDLPRAVRGSLLSLLGFDQGSPRLDHLNIPGLATVELRHPDGRATVDPQRWSRPARSWVSVLPVVLDRYPDNSAEGEAFVRLGCAFAGYPEPIRVEVLDAPAVMGTPRLRRSDLRRKGERPGACVHVRLTFGQEVPGPMVIGRLRHLGLGLCLPAQEARP